MSADETILGFGADNALVGILTEPGDGVARAQVGCLLLNTGLNHRVGQRRINVKLARRLAASGMACLRFDMSGIGDSRPSGSRVGFRQQQSSDMAAALDQFQASTGLRHFLVFGVCSGAANALAVSLADARVVGVLMFDGYDFLDARVRAERKLRRWLAFPFNAALRRRDAAWQDWLAWLRAPLAPHARQQLVARLRKRTGVAQEAQSDIFGTDAPVYTAADFSADLQVLLDRGVDVYLMYSALLHVVDRNMDMLAQLRGQPWLARIRYRFWPDLDHTVTLVEAQRRLLDAVDAWAVEVAQRPRTAIALPERNAMGAPAASGFGPIAMAQVAATSRW